MPSPCSICTAPDREAVDAALAMRQESLRAIGRRTGHHRSALSRHAHNHLSPALVALAAERETAGPASALDRLERLYADARQVLDAAKADGQGSLSLAAIGRLTNLVELLAKLTGELDESAKVAVAVDLSGSREFQRLDAALSSVSYCERCGPAVVAAIEAARGGGAV